MTAPAPLLLAEQLHCVRSQRTLFSNLSFALGAGETLLLTGPNGSGKTSLLRLLAGLLPAAGGRVLWQGLDVAEEPDAFRRSLCWVGHADGIKPPLTVLENLDFSCRLSEASPTPRALAAALETVGLSPLASQPARYLSAGQRRRLALARAVLLARPLWLLDEPTTALDDAGQAMLVRLLAAHAKAGGLAVIATHTPIEVAAPRRLSLASQARAA